MIHFNDGLVWIEEHLNELKKIQEKIESTLSNNYCLEYKHKILKDCEELNLLPELEEEKKQEEFDLDIISPNYDSDNLSEILSKILNDSKKKDEIVEEILNFHKNDNWFAFFIKSSINKTEFNQYFANFSQTSSFEMEICGFGIGRPSIPNQSIYVSCLEVQIKGEVLVKDELFIHAVVEGKGNYLFSGNHFQQTKVLDVDGEIYFESFPILYFLRS